MGGVPGPSIAGNVLRTSTTAVLSMRLPPPIDGLEAARTLLDVLTADPPEGARVTVTLESRGDGWVAPPRRRPGWRRPRGAASRGPSAASPGFTGEGGSIPFLAELGRRYPACQFVATGVLGPHSNAHSIDEMLDLPTTVAVTNAVASIVAAHARARTPSRPKEAP